MVKHTKAYEIGGKNSMNGGYVENSVESILILVFFTFTIVIYFDVSPVSQLHYLKLYILFE